MISSTFPAAKLLSQQRIDLAIAAMSGSASVSLLASENNVSRKFLHQQMDKARGALNDAFAPTAVNDEVLFNLPVTKVISNKKFTYNGRVLETDELTNNGKYFEHISSFNNLHSGRS
jgi:hypothetical protein